MIFHYRESSFKCELETTGAATWLYSTKLKVIIPRSLYDVILKEVDHQIIKFKLHKEKGENIGFRSSDKSKNEYWAVEAYLKSATISQIHSKEEKITVNFNMSVFSIHKLGKPEISEIRDILLNELL